MPSSSSSSSSASSSSLLLLSLAGAAAALGCWMALTPTGKAFALRVWEGDVEGARRRKAVKQLRFLEGRLEELVADVEACGWRLDRVEAEGDAPEEEGAAVSAYYHFDSSGRKFKSKWDTFDVDGALARLDAEEEEKEEEGGKDGGAKAGGLEGKGRRRTTTTLGAVRTELGRLNHDLEKLMACLDQVRGGEEVKERRKALVRASHAAFARLDALTQRVMQ